MLTPNVKEKPFISLSARKRFTFTLNFHLSLCLALCISPASLILFYSFVSPLFYVSPRYSSLHLPFSPFALIFFPLFSFLLRPSSCLPPGQTTDGRSYLSMAWRPAVRRKMHKQYFLHQHENNLYRNERENDPPC